MPRIDLSFHDKLKKYKIDQKAYDAARATLLALSYEDDQIQTLLLRRFYRQPYFELLKRHDSLIINNFSHQQIIKIASHEGGAYNLETVESHHKALKELGFTKENIVQMVNHPGGSLNLIAVVENYQTLIALGFNNSQIVSIVNRSGGAKCLDILSEYGEEITKTISHSEILKRVRAIGAWKNLLVTENIIACEILKGLEEGTNQNNKARINHGSNMNNQIRNICSPLTSTITSTSTTSNYYYLEQQSFFAVKEIGDGLKQTTITINSETDAEKQKLEVLYKNFFEKQLSETPKEEDVNEMMQFLKS